MEEKNVKKKLRKFFREKQREYFWLGFWGTERKLATRLPLADYGRLAKNLSYDEFYQLWLIFQEFGKGEELMAVIYNGIWFDRCCGDMRLFDSLTDEQLEKIVNGTIINTYPSIVSNLFLANGQSFDRQCRVLYVLHQDALYRWLPFLDNLSEINRVLDKLCCKENTMKKEEGDWFEWKKASEIFRKFASLPTDVTFKLLWGIDGHVAKRILQEAKKLGQDERAIYERFPTNSLYSFIVRTDFDILENADAEMYTWIYEHIAEEDKEEFFGYLVDEKNSDIELFDATICAGVYSWLHPSVKEEFLKKIFIKKSSEEFCVFYENLEEKEEFYEILSKDKEGKEIIDFLLGTKSQEELTFLEGLVKEKYVTK